MLRSTGYGTLTADKVFPQMDRVLWRATEYLLFLHRASWRASEYFRNWIKHFDARQSACSVRRMTILGQDWLCLGTIAYYDGRQNAFFCGIEYSDGRQSTCLYSIEHRDGRQSASAIGESTLSPVRVLYDIEDEESENVIPHFRSWHVPQRSQKDMIR